MSKRKRSGRGSNMGNDYQKAKDSTKSGKKWLVLPDGWSLFNDEQDTVFSLDFLPYEVKNIKEHPEGDAMTDDVWYRFPYRVHRNVGPQKLDLICPQTFGLPCPRCERTREIYNDASLTKKKAKALASKFSASRRSLYIVKVIGGKGEGWDKKIKNKKFIFDASDWFFFKLLDKEINLNDPDTRNFACLEAGYTLDVRFASDSFEGNSYAKPDRIDFKARKDYSESILTKHPDLGEIIKKKLPTYQEMVEADEDGSGSGTGKKGLDLPDGATMDDMDFEELSELVDTLDLSSEIDIDDFDEDDEDEVETLRDCIRESFKEIYGDLPESGNAVDEEDDDDQEIFPDEEALEDMDYDELCQVVETYDLSDIDVDDYEEDEQEEELIEAILEAFQAKEDEGEDAGDDDDLETEIEEAESFKELKAICKSNPVFDGLDFKKYKTKITKLQKKMLKLLNGSSTKDTGKAGKAGKSKTTCPHGHIFGSDWGDYDECTAQTCKSYKVCWKKNEDDDVPY